MSQAENVLVVPNGTGTDQKVYLLNFGVNDSSLKQEHIAALDRYVAPIMAMGGHASIIGTASRAGSFGTNMSLSQARAQSVIRYLAKKPGISDTAMRQFSFGLGEATAALAGVKDGTEGPAYRAVWIAVALQESIPPPPPPPPPANTSRKYACVSKTYDRDYYDRTNNLDTWIYKGASGNAASLRLIQKNAQMNYETSLHNNYPSASQKLLIGFYNSYEFRTWYVDGLCGIEQLKEKQHALGYVADYNTEEGLKKKGMHNRMAGQFMTQ